MVKQSKLNQIQQASQQTQQSVFSPNMFSGVSASSQVDYDNYNYMIVSLDDINYEKCEYPKSLYESIKNERLVSPVILSYEYRNAERGGRKFREKTGKYNIVDGNKRVTIYHDLKDEGHNRYLSIQALVLPLSTEEEEIKKIKEISNKHISGLTNVVKDITETQNHEITYCYRYEAAEVAPEKLVERDNKYLILQTEIDELEKSIYHAGLMQPLVVLPFIDTDTNEVKYEIQAGHKRKKAIFQLIEHAKEGKYPNNEAILAAYKTVSVLIIPMGATKEQVEKIYNDTNILSRHMSTDDVFTHISYFDDLPSRPQTKEEYKTFKEKKYRITNLANSLQEKFKHLGFPDWQNRRATMFLNVYYYGSDKTLEIFSNVENCNLTRKELEWIAVTYKDFNERTKQDEILEKAINDKNYLLTLQGKMTVKKTPAKIKIRKLTENLLKQKASFEKIAITPIDLKNSSPKDIDNAQKTVEKLKEIIDEIAKKIKQIEN